MRQLAATLTLLRHAPPVQPGLCAGRFELPVADAAGALDSLTHALREQGIRNVYSSPSLRCAQLAARLAHSIGVAVQPDARLLELNFGQWEGRSWNDITSQDRERFEAWSINWQTAAPPGGESVAELEGRVAAFAADLPIGPALVVTHAGVIRAFRVLTQGVEWQQALSCPIPYLVPLRWPIGG